MAQAIEDADRARATARVFGLNIPCVVAFVAGMATLNDLAAGLIGIMALILVIFLPLLSACFLVDSEGRRPYSSRGAGLGISFAMLFGGIAGSLVSFAIGFGIARLIERIAGR